MYVHISNYLKGSSHKKAYKPCLLVIDFPSYTFERIRQWPVTDIGGLPRVNESPWNKKNRIAFKIWTALKNIKSLQRFRLSALFHFATIHLREVSHQYPWLVNGLFFHIYILCIWICMYIFSLFRQYFWNNRNYLMPHSWFMAITTKIKLIGLT